LRQAITALVNNGELLGAQHRIHVTAHALAVIALILTAADDEYSMAALLA
jgi:hypothetical protein